MRLGRLRAGYSFEDFIEELDGMFQDKNVKQTVHLCLMTTRQGKTSLADFIQVFELNAEEAGYAPNDFESSHNTFLVETLENLVNDEVKDQLYAGGIEIPDNYWDFKSRLITINGVLERKKLRAAQAAKRGYWVPAKNVAPPVTQ